VAGVPPAIRAAGVTPTPWDPKAAFDALADWFGR